MEQQLFARHTGDDDLFLADADFLFKQDVQPQPQQQPHNPFGSGAHTSTSNNMDDNSGFDHVDSLLLGFDLDASSFEQSSFDASVFASTGFNNHNNAHLSHHRDNQHSFDGSASPTTTDDMSGSEMSSPAPSYSDSPASSPVRLAPAPARQSHNTSTNANSNALPPAHNMTPAMASAMHAFAAANALPYALPVAYFPPSGMQQQLNSNHKRPFQPDVLPTATSTSTSPIAAAVATAVDSAMSDAKKSKREIRQMKNRESANKSRLRRKAQMSELSDEVAELTKTQHELENTIAALRAENKSLHDQNTFLRSLIAKPDGSSSSSSSSAADSIALLPPMQQQLGGIVPALTDVNASAMENGQSAPAQPIAATQPQTKKLRTSRATTLSAASLSLCASVFGVTLLSDYESSSGGATSHVRGASRVLHALPASVRDAGFSPAPPTSLLEALWDSLTASWTLLSSSELAFGIVLNVLSFVVIMGLYHAWQASSLSTSTASSTASSTPLSSNRRSWSAKTQATAAAGARRHGAGRTESKHRSVSSHDAATDGSKSPSSKTTNHTSAAPLARMRELL